MSGSRGFRVRGVRRPNWLPAWLISAFISFKNRFYSRCSTSAPGRLPRSPALSIRISSSGSPSLEDNILAILCHIEDSRAVIRQILERINGLPDKSWW